MASQIYVFNFLSPFISFINFSLGIWGSESSRNVFVNYHGERTVTDQINLPERRSNNSTSSSFYWIIGPREGPLSKHSTEGHNLRWSWRKVMTFLQDQRNETVGLLSTTQNSKSHCPYDLNCTIIIYWALHASHVALLKGQNTVSTRDDTRNAYGVLVGETPWTMLAA